MNKIKFRPLSAFITLAACLSIFSVHAKEVTLKAEDGFVLSASYKSPQQPSKKGVLMLHQCNEEKGMYSELAELAASTGFHTLALDFRGYGKSVDDTYSLTKMRKKSLSRDDYFSNVRKMRGDHWPSDVKIAYQYLSKKVGGDNISFIGASCGGGQSLTLAKRFKPKSFTFFSSGMNDERIAQFVALSDTPALIIASQGDEYTFKSSKKIFDQAKNKQTRLHLYKGNGHGLPLFSQDQNLKNVMVDWFALHGQ
ncbi:MAG: alpha/beta fold hydrolase [Kangiellaceae bacterium]|nr:alpha/beta fold hydrolase [Kangiellaceae bacterium]